jgi:hypothetical protein
VRYRADHPEAEKDIGVVVVIDGDTLSGGLSERDCIRHAVGTACVGNPPTA